MTKAVQYWCGSMDFIGILDHVGFCGARGHDGSDRSSPAALFIGQK